MTAPYPGQAPVPALPPPRPPGVPVYVDTSNPVRTRYGAYTMLVEFAPGMQLTLGPSRRHQFFLAPGVYHAKFYTRYFTFKVGRAEAVFDTRSGRPVYVAYAAPYTIWTRGRAGYPPQKRGGLGAVFVIIGIAIAVPLLGVLVALLNR